VSFTNGEVNYQNTLEHLNILDADYYFKLIDCMQQQDLAGAMLLYDDINRKGFEGDMVLNGFAEFIRNLLVCKDERCAGLLEVVESFKDKYISTAKKNPTGWLISALNVLNETEINYKAARNKRLHVELALIKLSYLQQAIELAGEANGVSKKKIVEAAKPLAFRNILPLEIKKIPDQGSRITEAKLIIENIAEEKKPVREEVEYSNPIIANRQPASVKTHAESTTTKEPVTNTKLSPLDKIRNEVKGNGSQENGNGVTKKALQSEELQSAWDEYAAKLKEEKNAAWQNFEMAELIVQEENSFTALVYNNIQLRFIEQQGLKVSQFLREKLHNTQLQFIIVMQENAPVAPGEAHLTSREQFQKMAEQYPLVKELKDKLRLELDY
jgi:DNA polymerase-3 subunit gamma/tau